MSDARDESEARRLDPEGRYRAEGLRLVERKALAILAQFPDAEIDRTRDAVQLTVGDALGVVILVTAEATEIRLPTVEWTCGAYGPASSSRLWRRHRAHEMTARILRSIRAGIRARRLEFAACRYCGELVPPEHRHDDVCHGCAERHLGVVH